MAKHTIAEQIAAAKNHDELKTAGTRLFAAKLSRTKRTELVRIYSKKRRELDRAHADNTGNLYLKKMLYEINNMAKRGAVHIAKVGKTLYELAKMEGVLTKHEADLCFRAYSFQKDKAKKVAAAMA